MGGKKGEKIGDDDFFFQKTPLFRSAHDNYANQRMQRDDTMSNNAPISLIRRHPFVSIRSFFGKTRPTFALGYSR